MGTIFLGAQVFKYELCLRCEHHSIVWSTVNCKCFVHLLVRCLVC